jgi:hypothetical protein
MEMKQNFSVTKCILLEKSSSKTTRVFKINVLRKEQNDTYRTKLEKLFSRNH